MELDNHSQRALVPAMGPPSNAKDNGAVHARVTSDPDADQRKVYDALKIDLHPLETEITTI